MSRLAPVTKVPVRQVSERAVESHLVKGVRARGGVVDKTAAIGRRGFFDRVMVLPGGQVWFVELKRPKGGKLSPHQARRHEDYGAVGANVAVLASKDEVDAFLARLDGTSSAS
jgi:hypothetical protein